MVDYQAHMLWRIDREGVLHRFAGDGGPALEAELDCTCGVAVDGAGNLYLSDEWSWVTAPKPEALGF